MRFFVIVLLIGMSGCGAFVGAPAHPDAVGPVVTLAEGDDGGGHWRYLAYRTADGYCESIERAGGGGAGGCTSGPAGIPPDGASVGISSGSNQATFVTGTAGEDVAEIVVQTRHDGRHTAPTFHSPAELGMPVKFFLLALPEASTVLSVTTLDAQGEPLEVMDMGLSP